MKPRNLALEAAKMLIAAYRNGQRAGGHVAWEDIDLAWCIARAAVAQAKDRRERRAKRARAVHRRARPD